MKVENEYLVFDKEELKLKKITGHRFAELSGKDGFKTKGDCLVNMFLNIKENVDPYYKLRGEIAEALALTYLRKKYPIVKWTYHTTEGENYDMFTESKNYGGVIDIDGNDYEIIVEVKGKSMKNKKWILEKGNIGEEWQALHYGNLKQSKKVMMVYVFFEEKAEEAMKNHKRFSLKDIDIKEVELEIDYDMIDWNLEYCLSYRDECYENKRIPIGDISRNKLIEIGVKI